MSPCAKTARHRSLSCGVFARKQATILFTSGICPPHSLQTSGVQACCCCQVPRYSCEIAALGWVMPQPIAIARLRNIRCARMATFL